MAEKFEYCGYTAYKSQTARGRVIYEIYETATDTYCGDAHNKQDAKFMMKLWATRKQERAAC